MLRLAGNYLYLAGGELASKLATFVAISYLARVAGPSGFGYLELASAAVLCLGLLVDQGFGPYGAREIARSPKRTPALVSEILLVKFGLAAVAYGAMLVFVLTSGASPVLAQLLALYGLSLLAAPLLLQWVFQGHDSMPTVAAIQVVRQCTYAVTVFALVRDSSQLWGAAVAEVLGSSAAAAVGVYLYWNRFGALPRAKAAISSRLIKEGVPIGLSQLFWMIRMFGATILVGIVATSSSDVGYFGGAMRILIALHSFIWLYFFNMLPSMARAWQEGEAEFTSLVVGSLRRVVWLAAGGLIVWLAVAPFAAAVVYGPEFEATGQALQWLAPVAVFAAISGHYRFGLIAAGRQDLEMATSAIGSLAALLLIPAGYLQAGPSGAAAGVAASEVLVWAAAWGWARGQLRLVDHGRVLARPLAATLLGIGLLWLAPGVKVG